MEIPSSHHLPVISRRLNVFARYHPSSSCVKLSHWHMVVKYIPGWCTICVVKIKGELGRYTVFSLVHIVNAWNKLSCVNKIFLQYNAWEAEINLIQDNSSVRCTQLNGISENRDSIGVFHPVVIVYFASFDSVSGNDIKYHNFPTPKPGNTGFTTSSVFLLFAECGCLFLY